MLEREHHQGIDQAREVDFGRDRLRGLDDGFEIEVLDRYPDRAFRACRRGLVLQMRVGLIQLFHFEVGTPADVAGPGVAQIGVRTRLQTACRIEMRRAFAGDRLVLHEGIFPRGTNGRLIELLGLEFAPLEAGNLGADQRAAV